MSDTAEPQSRVLFVKSRGRGTTSNTERRRREQAGEEPRSLLLEDVLGCDVLDESAIEGVPGMRGRIYRRLPSFVAQALEAHRRSSSYDVVITWSERHTVAVAGLFAIFRVPTPHLALMFWLSKPSVRFPMRVFRSGVDRIITWSSVQRSVAIKEIGFRPEDVVLVKHPVDLAFYQPQDVERQSVFSAGSTQRDFETLAIVAKGIDLPFKIAAALVVALQRFRSSTVDVRTDLDVPANVQVEALGSLQLRDAYARSKVVVVPLLPSDIDAGVNVVLEAMAMARPVIVSKTQGQVDVVIDGENGIFVPPQDADALTSAIESILNDPMEADALGQRGRLYVEKHHRLEDFVENVRVNTHALSSEPSSSRARSPRERFRRR